MSDRGIKFAKDGSDITSTNPDDYNFWTSYPPLTLLEKKEVDIVAGTTGNTTNQTESVSYSYDFIPFVLATVKKTAGSPTGDNNNRYFMPAEDFAGINCSIGDIPNVDFDYTVKDGSVDITWSVECIEPMVSADNPQSEQTFTVELYFYMWELGSAWTP